MCLGSVYACIFCGCNKKNLLILLICKNLKEKKILAHTTGNVTKRSLTNKKFYINRERNEVGSMAQGHN